MNIKPVVFAVMFTALFGSSSVIEADEASKARLQKMLEEMKKGIEEKGDEEYFRSIGMGHIYDAPDRPSALSHWDPRNYVNGNKDFPIQTYQGVPTTVAIYRKLSGKPASYVGRVLPGYKVHKDGMFYHINVQTALQLDNGSWKILEQVQYQITKEGKLYISFYNDRYTPD